MVIISGVKITFIICILSIQRPFQTNNKKQTKNQELWQQAMHLIIKKQNMKHYLIDIKDYGCSLLLEEE